MTTRTMVVVWRRMRRAALAPLVGLGVLSGAAYAQQTRAEATGYVETSSHADVVTFLDSLERRVPGRWMRGTIGTTTQRRAIPSLIVARPLPRTPEEARRSGKPIVYVQGDIHGGEVEGKEALLALLRDLMLETKPNVLDSVVLIAIPIYNADGNDAVGPQERLRGAQNGPQRIGNRPNAAGLDLNRDYIKAEAPETQASLQMFLRADPDVFVDLHTTNGSYHGYALTYSPSLHPAAMEPALAPAGAWTRDTLLPLLRQRMRVRHRLETFDYGNFRGEFAGRDDPASVKKGAWETYEHVPRFGTNYVGLRNRVSVLSEAYSHDPFERRVLATRAYVLELLRAVAEHAPTVIARTRQASIPAVGTPVPLRATMTRTPFTAPILVEQLIPTGDSVRYEPGLRRGYRRSNVFTTVEMPVYDRFDATRSRPLPQGWVLRADQTAALAKLEAHGIQAIILGRSERVRGERFRVDSIVRAPRAFQGHQEVRVEGRWEAASLELPRGAIIIPSQQPLALLAAILLEPESDDGLTTWNFLDAALTLGAPHPVQRILVPLPASMTLPPR
ncbi:MAG: hypothetical protein RL625_1052 [Gemmatimonadota bacterium]